MFTLDFPLAWEYLFGDQEIVDVLEGVLHVSVVFFMEILEVLVILHGVGCFLEV